MTNQDYDLAAEAKKAVNKRYDIYYKKANAASDAGKLKLVSEFPIMSIICTTRRSISTSHLAAQWRASSIRTETTA